MKSYINSEPHSITLEQLLESRDNRAAFQQELLIQYNLPLISFMVNMPGPVKTNNITCAVHGEGVSAIEAAFEGKICFQTIRCLDTGIEGYFIVELDPKEVKERACDIEDNHPIGRLMDIDVHMPDGQIGRKGLGRPERRCLICDNPAPECARSRTHSVEELVSKIEQMAKAYFGGE